MMRWNEHNGSSKGWRFNPKVLRWACYALSKMGSAGYNVLSEVLHLPSINHVQKIRREAMPTTSGLQEEMIEVPL